MLILCHRLQPSNTASASLMCVDRFILLLTLRRRAPELVEGGRLEGWGTVEVMASSDSRTAGALPHPSRRALGRAPQGEEGLKGAVHLIWAMLVALAVHPIPAAAQGCGHTHATPLVGRDAIDGDTFRTTDGR